MDINLTYQKIIKDLESGSRALMRFSEEELQELKIELATELKSPTGKLEKIFCLIDHSALSQSTFEPILIEALNSKLSDVQLVFALNCSRKHIIDARFKQGLRLQYDFLETLKKLLFSSSPEVVEWTLRTIEECGSQGIYFLKEFDKIKPPPWKWFNSHQRAVREIIAMLERRWSHFEKH